MADGSTYINKDDIAEYKALYKARFGKEIDDNTAREQLSKLVRQMEIVYQPITKKQYAEYRAKNGTKRTSK